MYIKFQYPPRNMTQSKWVPTELLLKTMSEYDRFLSWVKQRRRCSDDDLETTINCIGIQYIRSIMKGVDEAAVVGLLAKW